MNPITYNSNEFLIMTSNGLMIRELRQEDGKAICKGLVTIDFLDNKKPKDFKVLDECSVEEV